MTESEESAVQCYSGYGYAQEPRALTWRGERYPVVEIEARWRLPYGPAFRVRTKSGRRFDLIYHEAEEQWRVSPLAHD